MKTKKNPAVEIGRNSSIYFAIGLNLMLFFTWQALEYKTYYKENIAVYQVGTYKGANVEQDIEEEILVINYAVPIDAPPPMPVVGEVIEIVSDDAVIKESVMESTEVNQGDFINPNTLTAKGSVHGVAVSEIRVEEVEEEVEVPFSVIENPPVFPGCDGLSNAEMRHCFEQKIQAHILKHFKYPDEAMELGVQGRVAVIFTIDSKGYITNLRSRGPDKLLEKEAERIISLLPQMKPGKQRGRPVKVTYAIPVIFKYVGQ